MYRINKFLLILHVLFKFGLTKPLWNESTIGLTTNEIRIYYNKTLDTRF
jgi:hypothetical protein